MPNRGRKRKINVVRRTGTDGGGEGGTSGNWGGGATEGTDEEGIRQSNADIIEVSPLKHKGTRRQNKR